MICPSCQAENDPRAEVCFTCRSVLSAVTPLPATGRRRRDVYLAAAGGLLAAAVLAAALLWRSGTPPLPAGAAVPTTVRPGPSPLPSAAPTPAPVTLRPAIQAAPSPTAAAEPSAPPAPAPSPEPQAALLPSPSAGDSIPAAATPPSEPAATPTPIPAGSLLVTVLPWADVFVDGQKAGQTPLRSFPLSPGPHAVMLQHPDYQPFHRKVTIKPGELYKLAVDLPHEGVRLP